jgi:hypothetical protein
MTASSPRRAPSPDSLAVARRAALSHPSYTTSRDTNRERLVGGPGVIVQPCAETESRIFDGVEAAEDGPSDRGNDTVPERVCDERCTSGLDHDQPIVAYPWYVGSVA